MVQDTARATNTFEHVPRSCREASVHGDEASQLFGLAINRVIDLVAQALLRLRRRNQHSGHSQFGDGPVQLFDGFRHVLPGDQGNAFETRARFHVPVAGPVVIAARQVAGELGVFEIAEAQAKRRVKDRRLDSGRIGKLQPLLRLRVVTIRRIGLTVSVSE